MISEIHTNKQRNTKKWELNLINVTFHYTGRYVDDSCRMQIIMMFSQHFITNWDPMCITDKKGHDILKYFIFLTSKWIFNVFKSYSVVNQSMFLKINLHLLEYLCYILIDTFSKLYLHWIESVSTNSPCINEMVSWRRDGFVQGSCDWFVHVGHNGLIFHECSHFTISYTTSWWH